MKRIAAGILAGMVLTMGTWFMPLSAPIEVYAEASYDELAADHIVDKIDEYVEPYLGTDTLNNYENGKAVQCHAFVNYVWKNVFGYDVYSSKCNITEKSDDYELLGDYINEYARLGDILRVDGKHSMVITSIDEDSVSGYDWLTNKKERECTYTWEGVKDWGDGTQQYWLYQISDNVYNSFSTDENDEESDLDDESSNSEGDDGNIEENPNRGEIDRSEPIYGSIAVQINNPVMTNNGEYQNIDSAGTTPMILKDRTVLPIRAIIEAMGGSVTWDDPTRTVTLTYKEDIIALVIDSTTMTVNGKSVEMDVAPTIYNERTLLPIRPIMENFNGQVEWYDSIQVVAITYEK